jgi:hypothetical protein
MTFAEYLEEHAKHVPYMQTQFLLKQAAKKLREVNYNPNNFYIRQLPNGDFEVVNED